VDPYDCGVGSDSLEAQAFVFLMEATHRDWAVVNATLGMGKSKSEVMKGVDWGWGRYFYVPISLCRSCVVAVIIGLGIVDICYLLTSNRTGTSPYISGRQCLPRALSRLLKYTYLFPHFRNPPLLTLVSHIYLFSHFALLYCFHLQERRHSDR
jgi:hypothetical protein